LLDDVVALLHHRRYVVAGAGREIRTRYAGAAMGVVWHVLVPLVQIGVYFVVFSQFFLARPGAPTVGHYVIFMLCGILPWFAFTETVGSGAASLVARENYLRKLPIPEAVFVAETAAVASMTMALYLVALIVVAAGMGVPPAFSWLLVPIVLVLLLAFGFGIALIVAPLCILFRDLNQFVVIALQLWFWVTPVLYDTARLGPRLRRVVELNPVTTHVESLRALLIAGTVPAASAWAAMLLFAIVPILAGLAICRRVHSDLRDAI
jgi:lipopolysaccharide transport system permease protein